MIWLENNLKGRLDMYNYTIEKRVISLALDRATYLLDQLICLARTKSPKYYGDYVKVEALLYLWESLYMYLYNLDIFGINHCDYKNPIFIRDTKLHIGRLYITLIARYGFDEINNLTYETIEQGESTYLEPVALKPPFLQEEVLNVILNVFGSFNTEQLIDFIKNTYAYKEGIKKGQSVVELDDDSLIATGEQIYDLITSNKEEKQDAYFIMHSFKESYLKIKLTSKDESAKKRELARFPKSTE